MSVSRNNEFPHMPSGMDEVNKEAVQRAESFMSDICKEYIRITYAAIENRFLVDKNTIDDFAESDASSGDIEIYVKEDVSRTAPRQSGKSVPTFSIELAKNPLDSKSSRMFLHVPSHGIPVEACIMPEQNKITKIYINTVDYISESEVDAHWYVMSSTGVYEYMPYAENAENEGPIMPLTDEGIWTMVGERLPEGYETISSFHRNIINWHTVPQVSLEDD